MKEVRKQQMKLPEFKPDPKFADLVFLKDNGKPYDLNEDNELWKSVNEAYGKRGVHIRGHALRHVAGTRLADANVSREIAMAILGHDSESLSFYYGRMTQKGQVDQIGKFGEPNYPRLTISENSKSGIISCGVIANDVYKIHSTLLQNNIAVDLLIIGALRPLNEN
jgi:hypothetical protein